MTEMLLLHGDSRSLCHGYKYCSSHYLDYVSGTRELFWSNLLVKVFSAFTYCQPLLKWKSVCLHFKLMGKSFS